jgi:DNA-directed RNA polymerase subunit M/transcription elongation factor TFIIS
MASVVTCTLTSKGEVKKTKLKLNEECELNITQIQAYFKKKSEPVQLGHYEYETYVLYLFGYKDGKAGTENKHEMPPPYDSLIAFGDMLLIVSMDRDWTRPCAFTPEQYQKFYDTMMGGFESVDGEVDDESDVVSIAASEDVVEDILDDDIASEGSSDSGSDSESDVDVDVEEEPVPIKIKKAAAKKPAVASSGYQKQQVLLQQVNFIELNDDDTAITNKYRQQAIKRFKFLKDVHGFTDETICEFEKQMYRSTCKSADRLKVVKHWSNAMFLDIYVNLQRTLMANLHDKSPINNIRLINRIKDGELKLENLPWMSSYEMYPENWKEMADRQMLMEQKLLEGNKGSATDRFKCNRCGKRECSYYEMQTRSADEPMTIFVNCLNCGKRWRQ